MREVFIPGKRHIFRILAAVAAALALFSGCSSDTGGGPDSGNITVPGCETLYLAAGQTRQSVDLYNPKENGCLFRISLILEDGETLWTSDLMKPGKSVSHLTLSRPLDAGEYPGAVLKYDCFTLQDQTPLNGAEIKVTIQVR